MRRIGVVVVVLAMACPVRAADETDKDTLAGRAKAVCDALDMRVQAGQALTTEFVDQLAQWSRRRGQAEAEAAADAAGKQKAWQGHLERMNRLLKLLQARQRNDVGGLQMRMGEYYVKEAEQLAGVGNAAAAAGAAGAAIKDAAANVAAVIDALAAAGQRDQAIP
jgi:hypothetical protein